MVLTRQIECKDISRNPADHIFLPPIQSEASAEIEDSPGLATVFLGG
jgi:hypothetical protein